MEILPPSLAAYCNQQSYLITYITSAFSSDCLTFLHEKGTKPTEKETNRKKPPNFLDFFLFFFYTRIVYHFNALNRYALKRAIIMQGGNTK